MCDVTLRRVLALVLLTPMMGIGRPLFTQGGSLW